MQFPLVHVNWLGLHVLIISSAQEQRKSLQRRITQPTLLLLGLDAVHQDQTECRELTTGWRFICPIPAVLDGVTHP